MSFHSAAGILELTGLPWLLFTAGLALVVWTSWVAAANEPIDRRSSCIVITLIILGGLLIGAGLFGW